MTRRVNLAVSRSSALTHPLGNHPYPLLHYPCIDPRADAGPRVKAPKCEGGRAKSSPPPRFLDPTLQEFTHCGRADGTTNVPGATLGKVPFAVDSLGVIEEALAQLPTSPIKTGE